MPAFRSNAVNFFLTYPQALELTHGIILEFLQALDPAPVWGIVAREVHEDGNPHFHCVFGYESKRDIRNERYFDINGYHPNIQNPRSLAKVAKYVTKDGDSISFGVLPDSLLKSSWGDIISSAPSPRRFMKSVLSNFPKEYATRYQAIEYMAERHFKRSRTAYVVEFDDFPNLPDQLHDWLVDEYEGQHSRRKSLILCSPSRFGKTEWARSLGHHMYFNGMVNFKHDWDDSANYIVFDDIDWEYLPNKKPFLGGQKNFTITDKYAGKRTVEWGKVCIYLCNNLPNFGILNDWIMANCVIITLTTPLFENPV